MDGYFSRTYSSVYHQFKEIVNPQGHRGHDEEFQLFVKILNGQTVTLNVSPSTSIGSLKNAIRDKQRRAYGTRGPRDVRLMYQSKQISDCDWHTLGYWNVQKESTIEVLGRLLNGPPSQIEVRFGWGVY